MSVRPTSGPRGAIVACLLLAVTSVLPAGCGDDAAPGAPDLSVQDAAPDTAPALDLAIDTPESPPDLAPVDTTEPVDTTLPPPAPGELGAACTSPEDCNDGWCLETSTGGLCSRSCTESCPRDWKCRQNLEALPSFASVCMPPAPTLCRPCDRNADCATSFDSAPHACIPTGDDGAFCGGLCETNADCPTDAFCAAAVDIEDTPVRQCRPTSGVCDCGPGDITDAASTACLVSTPDGRCPGRRTCEAAGLSACDAPTPAAEVCNDGLDDDCDGLTDEEGALGCTLFWTDVDGDGAGVGEPRCLCAAAGLLRGTEGFDCNDGDDAIYPRATERCNTLDDNCDDATDEPGAEGCTTFFVDADEDLYGTDDSARCLCLATGAWAATTTGDCNDDNGDVHPNTPEICNGIDDDCDGFVDPPGTIGCTPFYADSDGDGFGTGEPLCLCGPRGTYAATVAGDCDDHDAYRAPDLRESCSGRDDDCDGQTDEADAEGCATYWDDADRDTFGRPGSEACLCAPTGTFDAVRVGDCDDDRDEVNIAAAESCDSVDNDCDGVVDESECGLPTINWPTSMRDGRRTGHPFGFEGPIATDTRQLWKVQLIPGVPFENSPIVDPDGRIIVAYGGLVTALDPATGATIWQYTLPATGFSRASPSARVGGTIVVPAGNGVVLLDKDGQPVWDVDFGGEPGDLVTGSPMVDQNGIIYVISNTHARALAADGAVLWATPIEGSATKNSDPALGPDGRIYFSGARHAYSMSRTGTINWAWCPLVGSECDLTREPLVSVAINEVGRVLAPMGHTLYQLADGLDEAFVITTTDVLNGATPAPIGSAPAIFSSGYTCCNPEEYPLVTVAGPNGARWYNAAITTANYTIPIAKSVGSHGGAVFDRDGDIYVGSNAATANAQATFTARYSRSNATSALRGTAAWTATVDGHGIDGLPAIGVAPTGSYVVFGDSSGTIYSYGK